MTTISKSAGSPRAARSSRSRTPAPSCMVPGPCTNPSQEETGCVFMPPVSGTNGSSFSFTGTSAWAGPGHWSAGSPGCGGTAIILQSMSHFIVSCAPGEPARAPGTHETSRNAGNEDYFACRCPSFRPPDNDRAHSQAKHAVQLGGRDESSLVEVIEHGMDIFGCQVSLLRRAQQGIDFRRLGGPEHLEQALVTLLRCSARVAFHYRAQPTGQVTGSRAPGRSLHQLILASLRLPGMSALSLSVSHNVALAF